MLRDVDERSTLPDRVEALRVHLEQALGRGQGVCLERARALDNPQPSPDERGQGGELPFRDVMGEGISRTWD